MRNIFYASLFGILVLPFIASAQNYKKALKTGDALFESGMYAESIRHYEDLLDLDPRNPEILTRLGIAYLQTDRNQDALTQLQHAVAIDPTVNPDMDYFMARALQLNHQFDEALAYYRQYCVTGQNDKLLGSCQVRMDECIRGKQFMENPVKAKITNLGTTINTGFDEYAPCVVGDESMLVFTSRRGNSTGGKKTNAGTFYEDIYLTFQVSGRWTVPKNIGSPVNSDYHDAAVSVSSDGKMILLYNDAGGGDIFYSLLEDQEWSVPQPFPRVINSRHYEPHASLTNDLKTIYFSSDRPGGYGGLDLYRSTLDERGNWSDAENLGPLVNTEGDEDGPFIHPDGETLYYSSKGLPGMGGYDIFRSDLKGGRWQKPQNLGFPINSADDDIYFSLTRDNQHGYYASNTVGGNGGQDIYMISMPEPEEIRQVNTRLATLSLAAPTLTSQISAVEEKKSINATTLIRGKVIDAYSEKPLRAKMILTDTDLRQVVEEEESDSLTGNFLFSVPSGKNYDLQVIKEEYVFLSTGFDIPYSDDSQEIESDLELFRISIGSTIVLNNIFFDTDKATLRPESEEELNRLRDILSEVPNIKIRISGHTDNVGDPDYNRKLSEERARSVVNYLIGEGITADRLVYIGLGMEKPIASNDSQEGRQMNRRTEFEIIEN